MEIHISTPTVVSGGGVFGGYGHCVEGASHGAELLSSLLWPTSAQPLVSLHRPPLGGGPLEYQKQVE